MELNPLYNSRSCKRNEVVIISPDTPLPWETGICIKIEKSKIIWVKHKNRALGNTILVLIIKLVTWKEIENNSALVEVSELLITKQ